MKLYGNPMSTCTRKVLATLAEKNHKAEVITLDLAKGDTKTPEHLARQPFGRVPALDDDGFVLFESRAIIRYLDEKLPGTKLTPGDMKGRAIMEQWISVETSEFTPSAMKIVYQNLFNKFRGLASDPKVVEEGRTGVNRAADVMEKQLAKSPYIAGKDFTLADICYMPYIEYLFAAEAGDLITSRPAMSKWWKTISARPAWQTAIGKNPG